jgi:sugar phosphate isomerase/epimerase
MAFPTLLHSVSYSGSWGQARLSVDAFIDKAADLGFDGVMLMAKRPHLSLLDYTPNRRRELRAHLERRHMNQTCVAAYNNITGDWLHGEVPHFEMQTHYLTELARLTAEIGGDLLRIFTGYEIAGVNFAEQWQHVVAVIKECARRSADWGVTIGVQNHHDIAVGFESQYELVRAVNEPNCKAMFDAWAPALHGADMESAAAKMAPIVCHTTAANYQRLPRYHYQAALTNYQELPAWMQAVPMNEGFIDYHRFWNALRAGGFAGSISYEMCSPLRDGSSIENLDRYAQEFLGSIDQFRHAVT